MDKRLFTMKEVSQAMIELFDLNDDSEKGTYHIGEDGASSFMINKTYLERYQVIQRLQEYFKDKKIEGGACRISPITFIFTTFEIINIERL